MQFPHIPKRQCLLAALALSCSAISAADGFTKVRTEGALTYYEGTVTLQGKVKRQTDETWLELMGDLVCFEASKTSRALIPRSPDDDRDAWFCFEDNQAAQRLLNLPKSPARGSCGYEVQATIRIRNYVVNREESEVTDLAELTGVVARGPLKNIKCS